MNVDLEKIARSLKGRQWLELACNRAEKMGREQAFDDLAEHGFAHAHHFAEQISGEVLTPSVRNFLYGYRQVVLGYWMTM